MTRIQTSKDPSGQITAPFTYAPLVASKGKAIEGQMIGLLCNKNVIRSLKVRESMKQNQQLSLFLR